MRRDVENFFNGRQLPLSKLLKSSCRGLPKFAVVRAMNEVYESRVKIRPIQYGWEVRRLAKKYAYEPFHMPDVNEFYRILGQNGRYFYAIEVLLVVNAALIGILGAMFL